MWNTALGINSALWFVLGVFVVYSMGATILLGHWRLFVVALTLWAISNLTEVILACIG